jgi:hypothetical protein
MARKKYGVKYPNLYADSSKLLFFFIFGFSDSKNVTIFYITSQNPIKLALFFFEKFTFFGQVFFSGKVKRLKGEVDCHFVRKNENKMQFSNVFFKKLQNMHVKTLMF